MTWWEYGEQTRYPNRPLYGTDGTVVRFPDADSAEPGWGPWHRPSWDNRPTDANT